MTGAATWGAGVSAPADRGDGPAGRRKAASRRRSLALLLAFASGASAAGAGLGLLKQPDPDRRLDDAVFTAAAAVESARQAEARAQRAEKDLASAQVRLRALGAAGADQELADSREAERVGVPRLLKTSTALWGDERRRVLAAIVRESRRNGLDPALVAAVIQVESRFDPYAISGVGARGLMQLMPPTARWLLEKEAGRTDLKPAHLFDPVLNIELGTGYLKSLMDRFDGDLTRALIAYNAGPAVAQGLRRGTRSWRRLEIYPRSVLAEYRALLLEPEQVAAR
ncbi:MAG TPA: lytic transglycosylase domain-containing protein [Myxococcales bacterium]|nr:lytic transglycosylase domain-containing protein [Myxococcales bacterium]